MFLENGAGNDDMEYIEEIEWIADSTTVMNKACKAKKIQNDFG